MTKSSKWPGRSHMQDGAGITAGCGGLICADAVRPKRVSAAALCGTDLITHAMTSVDSFEARGRLTGFTLSGAIT